MSLGSTSLPPPTADELLRWGAIKAHPCVACGCVPANEPVEVHHLLSPGGLRLGHRYTVGLCQHCHSQVKFRTFKKHYPDAWLLKKQDEMIGWAPVELPAKRARNPAISPTARPSKSFRPATEARTLGGNATRSQDGTLPQRKRRGSKRGTWTARPDKVLPRGNRIV